MVKPPVKTQSIAIALMAIVMLSLVAVMPSSLLAQASPQAWSVQEVVTDGSFGAICMVLDSNNNPRIVHTGANGLMYYTFWDGADWRTQGIIQGGTPYALVLDKGNSPHILYRGANGVTYYATLEGSNWKFAAAPSGNRYSLALDKDGNPHLAYGTQLLVSQYPPGVTNNYYALNYAVWNGTGWSTQTVEKQISSSDTISLTLDSHNNPRIMYGNDTYYPNSGGYTITVKIATWTGTNWHIETGPSGLDFIGRMVLDSKDNPHFTYERNYPHESIGNVTLGYASYNGATWNTQTIAANMYLPGLTLQSDLALDAQDKPHVEFFNGSLMYATMADTKWNLQTVAPDQFAYGEGPLALDSHGSPNICYWVDDIKNTTAFVSMLIITTPTPMYRQGPLPKPTPAPAAPPKAAAQQIWQQPVNWSIVGKTTIVDGLIYVSSGSSGAGTLGLFCLNASTGAEIWSHSSLFLTYTVADGRVFLGETNYGLSYQLKGVVSCLNATTGLQIWNYSSGTSFTTPVVNEGIVYVPGFDYTLSTDVNIGSIYAFNATTGEKLQSFVAQPGTRFNNSPLKLQDGSLYALSSAYISKDASWTSAIYSLNASNGQEKWTYTSAGQFDAFTTDGKNIYVTQNALDTRNNLDAEKSGGYIYNGGVLALDASTGKLLWNYPIDSSVGTPTLIAGRIYVVSGEGVLYAFNASNGKILWTYTAGTGIGSLQAVNDYIYAGSSTGVICLNAMEGRVVWNFAAPDFKGSSPSSPMYANGIIYVGANSPLFFNSQTQFNVYALDASTGEKLWNYTLRYEVDTAPTIENGVVYISGNFVSTRSSSFSGPGVVTALKPSITSLPFRTPPPSPTPSPSPTQRPSPTVPEFPTWIILPLAILTALATALTKRTKTKSKEKNPVFSVKAKFFSSQQEQLTALSRLG